MLTHFKLKQGNGQRKIQIPCRGTSQLADKRW